MNLDYDFKLLKPRCNFRFYIESTKGYYHNKTLIQKGYALGFMCVFIYFWIGISR